MRGVRHAVVSVGLVVAFATPALCAVGPSVTAADASFRFVVLNDVHVSVETLDGSRDLLSRAIDEINALVPEVELVLVAGDLAQSANAIDLEQELMVAKQELDRLLVPYHVALGNHDVTDLGSDTAFRTVFGETHGKLTYKGVHIVNFRTASTRDATQLPATALDELDQHLGTIDPATPLIVFGHHPLGHMTPLSLSNSEEFHARVSPFNLQAVFSGHYHGTFEEQVEGVWYCTTPDLSASRCSHDGRHQKGYRLASVWADGSVSSGFFQLGHPPSFQANIPILRSSGNRFAIPGNELVVEVSAASFDGDPITYTALGLPNGATFDPVSSAFSWTPTVGQVGFHGDIRFLATNPTGTDTLQFGVRVLEEACVYESFDSTQQTWLTAGGSWTVENGELVQALPTGGSYFHTVGGSLADFEDLHFEADLLHESGVGYAGVVFRYVDSQNNYYLWNDSTRIGLRRRLNGSVRKVGEAVYVGPISGWQHVRVEAVGSNIKVYWGGELRIDVVDSTFVAGKVGFVCSNAAGRFDNAVLAGCPTLEQYAPVLANIGNRTAFVGEPMQVDIEAADLDGDALAFAAENLPAGAHFDAASQRFSWTPTAVDLGTWRDIVFSVRDGELHDAEVISVSVLDTLESCLFDGFADSLAIDEWNPTGGTWEVTDGELVVTSPTSEISTVSNLDLDDYTYAARQYVDGSGYGSLVFRAIDETHYYYLRTSNNNDELQIRKMEGSSYSILASDAVICRGVDDRWLDYRVQVESERIRVWVDDELMYDVVDTGAGGTSPYLTGSVGLKIKDAALRVDYVLVTDCGEDDGTTVDVAGMSMPPRREVYAYPNPFNPRTTARFALPRAGRTRVAIVDVSGRLVRNLFDGALSAGPHQLVWNGDDNAGRRVASGVYYLRLDAAGHGETAKLVLLK